MHERVLPPRGREALAALRKSGILEEFYLAGGTGAALHVGHRISEDFDWFTPQVFSSLALRRDLDRAGRFTLTHEARGTVTGLFQEVKVSFFQYDYPLLAPPVDWNDLRVAALLDIGLMKLTTISGRGSRKDFVDLYAICHAGAPLGDLLHALPRKYGPTAYTAYHLLRSLTYFDDAEQEPDLRMTAPLDWAAVTAFFQAEARRLFAAG